MTTEVTEPRSVATAAARSERREAVTLCASLFYFRLPREQWRARLQQVADSGYTCVDVYLPWNFHERSPGEWDFTGQRDVAAFLDLAHEVGLAVLARPGPYICSEWDGGALPAWLSNDPELRIRQNEPRYLAQVQGWFDQVLPILAVRQDTAGAAGTGHRRDGRSGPVTMVQLENELDFFDCQDRTGYLTALRDMAWAHGITVPLIACAGQGDIAGATGEVPGILPACNFYPDDASPDIEAEVRRYALLLADRGQELLISETNRSHRTLRRLLTAGARLIAPYLQSSGFNFECTPSVGNWGSPGSLMSHGYDFGGYVSSTGAERAEHQEARLLAGVVATLGDRLAAAVPTTDLAAEVVTDFPASATLSALALDGGGQLIGVPHLGQGSGRARLSSSRGQIDVTVPAGACPLLLVDLPLAGWGVPGTLALAGADLVRAEPIEGGLALTFASDQPTQLVLAGPSGGLGPGGEDRVESRTVDPGRTVSLVLGGQEVQLTVQPRVGEQTAPVLDVPDRPGARPESITSREHTTRLRPVEHAPWLEEVGVYRGRGRYHTVLETPGPADLLLAGAADIVEVTVAGQVHPARVSYGAVQRITLPEGGRHEVTVDVEIWGHANFDDARLPALALDSRRGLGSAWLVTGEQDLTAHWEVGGPEQWAGDAPVPWRSLGGWSSTRVGAPITYCRRLPARSGPAYLHLSGLSRPVVARFDAAPEQTVVHPQDPYLPVPAEVGSVQLSTVHDPSAPGVRAALLAVRPVTGWDLQVATDRDLEEQARRVGTTGQDVPAGFPITVAPGQDRWVDLTLPAADRGYALRPTGRAARVSAWWDGRPLGRVWLPDECRPRFTGGDDSLLWIPAEWTRGPGRLTLLLHGHAGVEEPVLTGLGEDL